MKIGNRKTGKGTQGKCPNIVCCEEKGIDGCYECEELDDCAKGFYQNGSDGRVTKAQELLGTDVKTGLKYSRK